MTPLELAAFRAYCVFIRNAVGTRMLRRDRAGNAHEETFEAASIRRWNSAPESTRQEFIAYAKAMEPVFQDASQGAFA
jgi:hypothetical protein